MKRFRPGKYLNMPIRTTLFAVIMLLNVLIATQSGLYVYRAWNNHANAQVLGEITTVINMLYDAEKYLSLERGTSIAVLYAAPRPSESLLQELKTVREKSDFLLETSLDMLQEEKKDDLSPVVRQIEDDYLLLRQVRRRLDAALADINPGQRTEISREIFEVSTVLITDTDILIETYSRPFIKKNLSIARPLRFMHVIWGITEYAGREYALLGQLLAENKYPTPEEQEKLAIWRGRIHYGWELANSALLYNDWGKDIEPFTEEAETHYFMNFDQIKDIFDVPPQAGGRPSYPISADMWMELASQAVDSLHSMNDAVLNVSQAYVARVTNDAERSIIVSFLLFATMLALSFYSWRLITLRVIKPVNTIADTLYRATKGEYIELPTAVDRHDEIGKLVDVLRVFQTNAQELEKERDKAQAANVAKSEFLANMSHEIRTPMNVVIGLSNILARTEPLTPRQQEFIKTLHLSAEALLTIINDLLDFSKIETQTFELEKIPFTLSALIEEIVSLMSVRASEKGLKFDVNLSSIEGKEYIGDPTRVRQILMNLCDNAIKFTESGRVSLEVQSFSDPRTYVEDVHISIIDTGIGIPADKLDFVFEKFTQADSSITRKYGGTGLGLAIAKTFVEMMGGKITVSSMPGKGTTFTVNVKLPLKVENMPVIKKEVTSWQKSKDPDENGARVLLVEDYQPNAVVAGMYLEQFGFDYDLASNGFEALDKVKSNKYHAVLMDIQMKGMDGYRTTEEIRDFEKKSHILPVRIIGMTAFALSGDREKCLAAGMNDYIAKPFKPEELRQKLV